PLTRPVKSGGILLVWAVRFARQDAFDRAAYVLPMARRATAFADLGSRISPLSPDHIANGRNEHDNRRNLLGGERAFVWSLRNFGHWSGPIALLHIGSGPRLMAATPVRLTSTSPKGRINSMKASILLGAPVISKTKLVCDVSIALARKIW